MVEFDARSFVRPEVDDLTGSRRYNRERKLSYFDVNLTGNRVIFGHDHFSPEVWLTGNRVLILPPRFDGEFAMINGIRYDCSILSNYLVNDD